jgi:hypothetical protein
VTPKIETRPVLVSERKNSLSARATLYVGPPVEILQLLRSAGTSDELEPVNSREKKKSQ